MSRGGSDNGHPGDDEYRLRGIVPFNSDSYRDELQKLEHWRNTYRAQDKARSDLKREKLLAGGDESLFKFVMASDIYDDMEDIELSASGLLLSHGIHRISGPPGSGKTRVSYWEVLQRVRAGEYWIIFDNEMGQKRFRRAMAQLGATGEDLSKIYYIDASGITPNLIEHGRALIRKAVRQGFHGILYDSQITFLGAAGVEENDPVGIRDWTTAACSGIQSAIIIDHTGHSDVTRGRGSTDKAAGCDVDMYIKSESPFALGTNGAVTLVVNKDRSGTLQTKAEITIEVECLDDGSMNFYPMGEWGFSTRTGNTTVAETLGMLLLRAEFDGRDYASATELQGAMAGSKGKRLGDIARAVADGEITEEKHGKERRFSLP